MRRPSNTQIFLNQLLSNAMLLFSEVSCSRPLPFKMFYHLGNLVYPT